VFVRRLLATWLACTGGVNFVFVTVCNDNAHPAPIQIYCSQERVESRINGNIFNGSQRGKNQLDFIRDFKICNLKTMERAVLVVLYYYLVYPDPRPMPDVCSDDHE
jgi:hypothetical protein